METSLVQIDSWRLELGFEVALSLSLTVLSLLLAIIPLIRLYRSNRLTLNFDSIQSINTLHWEQIVDITNAYREEISKKELVLITCHLVNTGYRDIDERSIKDGVWIEFPDDVQVLAPPPIIAEFKGEAQVKQADGNSNRYRITWDLLKKNEMLQLTFLGCTNVNPTDKYKHELAKSIEVEYRITEFGRPKKTMYSFWNYLEGHSSPRFNILIGLLFLVAPILLFLTSPNYGYTHTAEIGWEGEVTEYKVQRTTLDSIFVELESTNTEVGLSWNEFNSSVVGFKPVKKFKSHKLVILLFSILFLLYQVLSSLKGLRMQKIFASKLK